jgi:Flp pilus assembly protein TadG
LGPRTWRMPKQLRRRRDERGAEMVEFALVVVLLIALLYGIISYGLILAAQSTITQAAADGARSGIVTTTPVATAEGEACTDIGWMNKTCGAPVTDDTTACTFSPNPADAITAFACQKTCPSNPNIQCLTVTVSYNYAQAPLFPELPGLNVITPSTISSSNTLQISNPSS